MNKTDFYDPIFYDAGVGDTFNESRLDFYFSKISSPQRILDIGAGTGRVAIPLVLGKNCVTCIDMSQSMIDTINSKKSVLPYDLRNNLTTICSPFEKNPNTDPAFKMDTIVAVDDFVLHYRTIECLDKFFEDTRSWLKAGGKLLTDVRTRRNSKLNEHSQKPFILNALGYVEDVNTEFGTKTIMTYYYEIFDKINRNLNTICQYHYVGDKGLTEVIKHTELIQRMHTNNEIVASAEKNGFVVKDIKHESEENLPDDETWGMFEMILDA